jgi:hypothetical protein
MLGSARACWARRRQREQPPRDTRHNALGHQEDAGWTPAEPTAGKFARQLTSPWHYFNAWITFLCSNFLQEAQETAIGRTTQVSSPDPARNACA